MDKKQVTNRTDKKIVYSFFDADGNQHFDSFSVIGNTDDYIRWVVDNGGTVNAANRFYLADGGDCCSLIHKNYLFNKRDKTGYEVSDWIYNSFVETKTAEWMKWRAKSKPESRVLLRDAKMDKRMINRLWDAWIRQNEANPGLYRDFTGRRQSSGLDISNDFVDLQIREGDTVGVAVEKISAFLIRHNSGSVSQQSAREYAEIYFTCMAYKDVPYSVESVAAYQMRMQTEKSAVEKPWQYRHETVHETDKNQVTNSAVDMQDATRYGFRDRDFFKKNDAVVVGEYREVPVFKKDGKYFVAYLVSDCTDSSERDSCKVSEGFGTKAEAELAAMRCSVYPFLQFDDLLEVYKGFVIIRQTEYIDDESAKNGLFYSAATLVRGDLSKTLGGKEYRHAMFARYTPFMKCVEDVRTYIDGIKRTKASIRDVESVPKDAVFCSNDGWDR